MVLLFLSIVLYDLLWYCIEWPEFIILLLSTDNIKLIFSSSSWFMNTDLVLLIGRANCLLNCSKYFEMYLLASSIVCIPFSSKSFGMRFWNVKNNVLLVRYFVSSLAAAYADNVFSADKTKKWERLLID